MTTQTIHPWNLSRSQFEAYSAGTHHANVRYWLDRAKSYMNTPNWRIAKQCITYAREDWDEYQRCMAEVLKCQS
jgi:hypothetical protein